MPTFQLTLAQARRVISLMEKALKDGYPPSPGRSGHVLCAHRIVAEELGISQTTVRGWVGTPTTKNPRISKFYKLKVDWSVYSPLPKGEPLLPRAPKNTTKEKPEVLAPTIHPNDRRYQLALEEAAALRKQVKELHRSNETSDIIREIVGDISDTPRDPPNWVTAPQTRQKHKPTAEVPVTIWSDWHLGEVVEKAEVNGFNEFNMAVAEARIERLVETTINICTHNHVGVYPGIVVNLLGDFVSGGIHAELKATDEEEVIPASLKAADWLIGGLERIGQHFKKVYVPCATGNHGRLTPKPEYKRYYRKNFDWLITQIVARHFADDKRFQFDSRPSNDVHYRVFGQRYLACHGDMLGVRGGDGIIGSIGPVVRGEVKQTGQSSALGIGFDKLLMGHWHQRLWLPRAIVNNALKGFDEYAMKGLGAKPDRPTQALWFVHPSHGETARWDLYVDNKPTPSTDWVSWKNPISTTRT